MAENKENQEQQLQDQQLQERQPSKPYSRKARILAWIGVAFMVFLVIMYTYSLASGKIMEI